MKAKARHDCKTVSGNQRPETTARELEQNEPMMLLLRCDIKPPCSCGLIRLQTHTYW